MRGLSLVEVLVALVILAFSLMVTLSMSAGTQTRLRKAQLLNNVSVLLERKMVEVENEYRGKPIAEIKDEDKGVFGKEYPQYRWEMKSQQLEIPDLSGVILAQSGVKDEMFLTMLKQGFDFLSKSAKEVKVSVFVKSGKKETEYSVTQYFVDYTQELGGALGGGAPEGAPK